MRKTIRITRAAMLLLLVIMLVSGIACVGGGGETYRGNESISAVHAHLYSLANGIEAEEYVQDLISGYFWKAKYRPADLCGQSDEECWEVYNIIGGEYGASMAHWHIYGSDMNEIIPSPSDTDAAIIEHEILLLNVKD